MVQYALLPLPRSTSSSLLLLTVLGVLRVCAPSPSLADDRFLISESGSGRASGYSEANKIITAAGKTHVCWLDSHDGGFYVKIRTYDHAAKRWSPVSSVGEAQDNHGGPSLAIDSRGYLHIAYYPHSQPMRYRRSLHPHDASEWSPEVEFGKKLTYPSLVVGPDDSLYLVARQRGDSSTKWTLQFFSKPADGEWSEPTTLIEANELSYAHFQASLAWGPDHKTLHLGTRMYGDVPRWGFVVGYMKTSDFGKTWQRSDNTPISLPACKSTIEQVEVVAEADRERYASACALRGGSIAVDSENRPHLLFNTLSTNDPPVRQAWISTPSKNGGWQKTSLNDKLAPLPAGWGLGMGGGIQISPDGTITVALTMANDSQQRSHWGSSSSEVIYGVSKDGGKTFDAQVISQLEAAGPNWLPNLERPTGFNQPQKFPAVLYLSGDKGENNNAILQNQVYYWHPALD